MKVVIGVDASPSSKKALEWVLKSLAALDQVFVVAAADAGPAMSDSILVKIEHEAAEGHVREATLALATLGPKVTGSAVVGDPRAVLVDFAQKEGADLLVVGSRGRTGLARLLLGSVAAHVAAHAPCSVLVVRSGAK